MRLGFCWNYCGDTVGVVGTIGAVGVVGDVGVVGAPGCPVCKGLFPVLPPACCIICSATGS